MFDDFRDLLLRRAQDYQQTFQGEAAERVLADIFRFSGMMRPSIRVSPQSGMVDPVATAIAEGRREVALRIASMCKLTYTEIANLPTEAEL
jgi:hypothetical protein